MPLLMQFSKNNNKKHLKLLKHMPNLYFLIFRLSFVTHHKKVTFSKQDYTRIMAMNVFTIII